MGVGKALLAAWERSTIVSGLLSLGLLGLLGFCVVSQIDVPDALSFAFGAVVTYFFVDKARKDHASEALAERRRVIKEIKGNGKVSSN